MSGNEAVRFLIDALTGLDVPHVVVGSYASNIYGSRNATMDAAVLVERGGISVEELSDRLRPALRLSHPARADSGSMIRRDVAEVAGSPFAIELFDLSDDPHDRERFRRRRLIQPAGRPMSVLTVEDVIVTKLRWARPKDRDDVRDVIAVQGDRIDWDYVHSWTERHGTRALLDEIRRSIPPI